MSEPYYYLVSSLPLLAFEAPPPLGTDSFRAVCAEHLSVSDLAVVNVLLGTPPPAPVKSAFLDSLNEAETQIRDAAVRLRASRARTDAGPFLRPHQAFDVSIEKSVADAFAKPSPLDRELALDRLRWQLLDALAGFDPFTSTFVFAYAAKLRILERWHAMTAERGSAEMDRLLAGYMTGLESVSNY